MFHGVHGAMFHLIEYARGAQIGKERLLQQTEEHLLRVDAVDAVEEEQHAALVDRRDTGWHRVTLCTSFCRLSR